MKSGSYQASADDGVLFKHGAHRAQEDDACTLTSCHSQTKEQDCCWHAVHFKREDEGCQDMSACDESATDDHGLLGSELRIELGRHDTHKDGGVYCKRELHKD